MNRTSRLAAITIAGAIAATCLLGAPAAADALRPYALDDGHIDLFELTYDQTTDQLVLQVKDDTGLYGLTTAYRDPSEVTVLVDTATTAVEIPEGYPELEFLGQPGDTVYLLDQSGMVEDQPWPGWSTERLNDTLPAGVEIPYGDQAISLAVEVSGPGEVFTFMNGGGGEITNRYIDTADPAPDTIPVDPGTHTHTSWVFTAPGDYHLTVTPSAPTTSGATLSGPAEDFHFHVGDGLPDSSAPQLSVTPTAPATALPGEQVTFTASQDPVTALDRYQWYRWGDGGYQALPSTGPTVTVTMPDHDEIVYVVLFGADGRIVADASAYLPVAAPPVGPTSQAILTALDDDQGLLAISVDPADRTVTFPAFELSPDATRWETGSELRPIRVTDTRSGGPGWTASGQATDLTNGTERLDAGSLGWSPKVVSSTPGMHPQAGPPIDTHPDGGPGLASSATLATAPVGASQGTAQLGADLRLHAPTEQATGTYTGVVTLTAI